VVGVGKLYLRVRVRYLFVFSFVALGTVLLFSNKAHADALNTQPLINTLTSPLKTSTPSTPAPKPTAPTKVVNNAGDHVTKVKDDTEQKTRTPVKQTAVKKVDTVVNKVNGVNQVVTKDVKKDVKKVVNQPKPSSPTRIINNVTNKVTTTKIHIPNTSIGDNEDNGDNQDNGYNNSDDNGKGNNGKGNGGQNPVCVVTDLAVQTVTSNTPCDKGNKDNNGDDGSGNKIDVPLLPVTEKDNGAPDGKGQKPTSHHDDAPPQMPSGPMGPMPVNSPEDSVLITGHDKDREMKFSRGMVPNRSPGHSPHNDLPNPFDPHAPLASTSAQTSNSAKTSETSVLLVGSYWFSPSVTSSKICWWYDALASWIDSPWDSPG
jgi:hypothetical protein